VYNSPSFSNTGSSSVIYSNSSDDIGELGIFRAPDENTAALLFSEVKSYVDQMKNEKRDFLKNYLPNELSKLDNAEVRQLGNYVVFSFIDDSDQIFKEIEKILK